MDLILEILLLKTSSDKGGLFSVCEGGRPAIDVDGEWGPGVGDTLKAEGWAGRWMDCGIGCGEGCATLGFSK